MPGKDTIRKCAVAAMVGFWWIGIFGQVGICQAGDTDPVSVMVSILPQSYFVERIGGERVRVNVLVAPGKSPATYAPSPAQISNLAGANVYFRIGVPFENVLLGKIGSIAGQVLVVDTRRGIHLRKMETGHSVHESEKTRHAGAVEAAAPSQGEAGHDPHIWLDPKLVRQQAVTICETLTRIDVDGAAFYQSNLEKFSSDLEALDEKLKRILAPFHGENLYVFHPSFGYFADAYGLRQFPIEIEGKAPKGKDLYQFIQAAKSSKARAIFVQPQFDRHAAEKIAAAIQGAVVPLDPLAGNYMENMESMALKIADAMKR
jgi:zinc transport system substrate-binding protein